MTLSRSDSRRVPDSQRVLEAVGIVCRTCWGSHSAACRTCKGRGTEVVHAYRQVPRRRRLARRERVARALCFLLLGVLAFMVIRPDLFYRGLLGMLAWVTP